MFHTLHKEKAKNKDGEYKHKSAVIRYIFRNKTKAKEYLQRLNLGGLLGRNDFDKMFSISGSLIVTNIELLDNQTKEFLKNKGGRFFIRRYDTHSEYHLRGPRYIVALDPHYSVIQKLDLLLEDLRDCVEYLRKYNIDNNQYLSVSIILDYLKNSLITLLNSYLHQEKLGNFRTNDANYQANRVKLIEASEQAVYSYYLSLADLFDTKMLTELIQCLSNNVTELIAKEIKTDFRKFTFSSKSLVRPEATHPLVLLSYAWNLCNHQRAPNIIVGLPSGSTEASCLVHQLSNNYFENTGSKLVLIPFSIHSIKDIGETHKTASQSNFHKLLANKIEPENCNLILIVDDNSASGRTIEKVYGILKKRYPLSKIVSSVVEADLRRIDINLRKVELDVSVCHPSVYKYSTNILPISTLIAPKFDLKEVQERRLLYHYYLQLDKKTIVDEIVNHVIADSIEHRIESNLHKFDETNSIMSFKHTFLSNFYSVKFSYQGRKYNSVEQAYLRQKFDDKVLSELTPKQKDELNEVLKIKGIADKKNDFSKAFYDNNLPSGVLKRWSNKLKEWGLESKDWDAKRLRIMTELLLLKFTDIELMKKLIDTGNLYLIEGNDWNDTFWGVCNGRGRNYLGRILMCVRKKILSGEVFDYNENAK